MAENRCVAEKYVDCINNVLIYGIFESDFEYSHRFAEGNFYKTRVRVARLSGTEDCVPIVIPEALINDIKTQAVKGKRVEIGGQFRSYSQPIWSDKKFLELFVFVTSIRIDEDDDGDGETDSQRDYNGVIMEGYVCRPTVYRLTPFGREITEIKLVVRRGFGKSDFIPCITWGKIAQNAKILETGDKIRLNGRIQSRQYAKYFSDSGKDEIRTTYEVSISSFTKVN